MRKLCPNVENAKGLATVLEVPIPEKMWTKIGRNSSSRWKNLRALMKAQLSIDKSSHFKTHSKHEFIALIKLVGSPLIPQQVQSDHTFVTSLKISPKEACSAKYIVQQYIAAMGGVDALDSMESMYVVGQVRMIGSEMRKEDAKLKPIGKTEVGGFVLWQKNPNLWHFELVVSGYKVSAGSDGNITWNQSSSQPSHANKGPPRPLRRFFQGLDPRCTTNLFVEAKCVGEKRMNNEECFLLKLEAAQDILESQNTEQTEIIRHTMWGYFSQRTGLLIKFEDNKLMRMKSHMKDDHDFVFWETSIESLIEDYRYVNGINIAHGGKSVVMLCRYGMEINHKRKIEETWKIEEVGFNVCGLSMDCFLPPSDIYKGHDAMEQID
ncbi:uncharacterized protein [Arachis hypogaea]|uniref:DUF620 domain-containing protein n=1 Tax=Arachis hypogaea TaxID=3818 RepID=A0A444YWQ3_ARAHY|nr:DUF620 family protein [Arachis hypogaea]RYR06362.1 hypothetical protein Ahy_B06g086103 [Arachis hypogaea]